MVKKRNLATITATSFGAAMATLTAAPELQAAIVPLSFSPATIGPGASLATLDLLAPAQIGALSVDNTVALGKNFYTLSAIDSIGIVSLSQSINAGDFSGTIGITNPYSASGIQYIGFTIGQNVGWFSVDLGGAGNDLTFTGGQYGNAAETLQVGSSVVPEPSAPLGLALLALGASGIRRRRSVASI